MFLCFGSMNIDYVYSVSHFAKKGESLTAKGLKVFPGGKGMNQAIALASAGEQVMMAGKVGTDGKMLIDWLEKNGVDTSMVSCDEQANTGNAIIQVEDSGDNCIVYYPGANQQIDSRIIDDVMSKFNPGDWIILQNEINDTPRVIAAAKARGLKICINPAPMGPEVLDYPLDMVDLLVINETEGEALCGKAEPDEIIEAVVAKVPNASVLLTLGDKGSILSENGKIYRQGIYEVETVDTTAAGDTFIGYFMSQYSKGVEPQRCLEIASKASAICVSRQGASVSIPKMNEVV